MAQAKAERRGLGRGLSALMADVGPEPTATEAKAKPEATIDIARIAPNPDQPRRTFTEDALNELAASIREKGVIQPLVLRPDPRNPDGYQIVAGERRWRAAQKARLHQVPAIVRELDDTEVLELAIIENIQRTDLNAVEEASGYRQLMDRFGPRAAYPAPAPAKKAGAVDWRYGCGFCQEPRQVFPACGQTDPSAGDTPRLLPRRSSRCAEYSR